MIYDLNDKPQFLFQIANYLYEEWGQSFKKLSRKDWIGLFKNHLLHSSLPKTFVHITENRLTGTASLIKNALPYEQKNTLWLCYLFVNKFYRKSGIGKSLIKKCLKTANENGYDELHLFTEKHILGYYLKENWIYVKSDVYANTHICVLKRPTLDQNIIVDGI